MKCSEHGADQADALLDQANDLYGDFQLKEAIDILIHLLDYHTDTIEEWNICELLGMCYYYIEDYDKAANYLERAYGIITTVDNEELSRLIILDHLGATWYAKEDYKKSLNFYNQAEEYLHYYESDERRLELYLFHLRKGRSLLYLERYEDSRNEFYVARSIARRMISGSKADNRKNILRYEIGTVNVYIRSLDEAYENLSKVDIQQLDSSYHPNYWHIFSKLLVLRGDYERAIQTFKNLEGYGDEDIDWADAYYYQGMAFYTLGRYSEAKTNFKKALHFPTPIQALKDRCTEYLKKSEEAI